MFRWMEWSTAVILEIFLLLDYYISKNTCLSITPADQTIYALGPGWIERGCRVGLADQASNRGVTDAVAVGREAENQTTRGHKLRPWARVFDRRAKPKQRERRDLSHLRLQQPGQVGKT